MLKIEAIGNIGNDASIKSMNNRDALSFSIAHSERRNGTETTTWVECIYFCANPERLQPYLTKGKNIHVRGNMSVSTWVDRSNATRVSVTCYVSELDFCGNRGESQSTGMNNAAPSSASANTGRVIAHVQQPAAPHTPPPPTSADMFNQSGDDDLPF